MKNLLNKLPEQYQDVEIGDKVYKGIRDCEQRWKLIKDRIRPHSVVFDIGSSLGYFAHKIAKEYPDSLVVSFEKDNDSGRAMVDIQKKIFKEEGIYNVVVCYHRLTKEDIERWLKHVEFVDTILLMSSLI